MPTANFDAPLDVVTPVQIAAIGNRILDIQIINATLGAGFRIKLGGSEAWPEIIGTGVMILPIELGAGTAESDRVRGAWIIPTAAVPNGRVQGFISYSGD